MNPLALLCTLHAEGPATLRKLRSVGLTDLDDLAAFPEEQLAAALDCDIVYARRFVCEGRLLGERFGFDVSEAPEPRRGGSGVHAGYASAARAAEPAEPGETNRAPAPPPERPHAALARTPARVRIEAPARNALREGDVEGLDAGWCAALVGQGVLTLDALADAPGLALARALGRPYPQLLDLQCLARRRLREEAAEQAPGAASDAVSLRATHAQPAEPPIGVHTLYPRAAPQPARNERLVVPTEFPGSGGPFS